MKQRKTPYFILAGLILTAIILSFLPDKQPSEVKSIYERTDGEIITIDTSPLRGTSMQYVNGWKSWYDRSAGISMKLYNNQKVKLLDRNDTYVKVMDENGCIGWFHKGFIKEKS